MKYYIFVSAGGDFRLDVDLKYDRPLNDECANAAAIHEGISHSSTETSYNALTDFDTATCGIPRVSSGVWYLVDRG